MTMRRQGEESHPDDPVGPEPVREAPDQRAAWYEAFAAGAELRRRHPGQKIERLSSAEPDHEVAD
jgi:hypothetical protein